MIFIGAKGTHKLSIQVQQTFTVTGFKSFLASNPQIYCPSKSKRDSQYLSHSNRCFTEFSKLPEFIARVPKL